MKIIPSIILFLIYFFINSLSAFGCTGFYVTKGDVIFAGNNEDNFNPETKMWVVPGENGNYGRIFFGFDDYSPQGGINEKGLFFDGFALEPKKVKESIDKKNYDWLYNDFLNEILSSCATVDEVIAYHISTVQPESSAIEALRLGVDVVTFASPSSVNGFVDVLNENDLDIHNFPNNPLIACIGQVTAEAVRDIGLQVHIEAQEHTIKGLVAAMKEYKTSVVE